MRARTFTTALSLSRRAYSLLLPLYPLVLRCRYGPEMVDVFEQQIRGACKQSGFTGLARVWLCVVSEIVQGALPSQLSWEMLGVSVVSVLSSLVLLVAFFWASGIANHCTK